MLRSYFLIAFRILWRNKITSLINIISLTIGIASFLLIMIYFYHETSYDKFNEHYERIYRVQGDDYGRLPPVVGTYIKNNLPEVENMARLSGGYADQFISYAPEENPEDLKHLNVKFFWADSTTFEVFTLPFIKGDPVTALTDPLTIVLTESTARKLFGNSDPLMKNIEYHDHQFMVTGIIEDVKMSHMEIDALFSFESIARIYPDKDLNRTGPSSWLWSAT